MTDQERKVMKMALDALKMMKNTQAMEVHWAISAVEAQLAQEQTKCPRCGEVNPAEIHTCSPQVAQEPVAWINAKESFCGFPKLVISEKYKKGFSPVYTAPPSKEWVGLHWADMPETYAGDKSFLQGAKWAEVKLKEKNT